MLSEDESLQVDEHLAVRFTLPNLGRSLLVRAEVRWIREREGRAWGEGRRFVELPGASAGAVQECVRQLDEAPDALVAIDLASRISHGRHRQTKTERLLFGSDSRGDRPRSHPTGSFPLLDHAASVEDGPKGHRALSYRGRRRH